MGSLSFVLFLSFVYCLATSNARSLQDYYHDFIQNALNEDSGDYPEVQKLLANEIYDDTTTIKPSRELKKRTKPPRTTTYEPTSASTWPTTTPEPWTTSTSRPSTPEPWTTTTSGPPPPGPWTTSTPGPPPPGPWTTSTPGPPPPEPSTTSTSSPYPPPPPSPSPEPTPTPSPPQPQPQPELLLVGKRVITIEKYEIKEKP